VNDHREQQRRKATGIRSVMDMIMGSLFSLIGVYFLTYNILNINVFRREPSPVLDVVIGVVFILYGGWRIYRGYKKNYNR
jgi:threonine/homoserine/homoserine lactone efflux protein